MVAFDAIRPVSAATFLVRNVTGLYTVEVARIFQPVDAQDVAEAIRGWPGKIAIGGGRYSMGGQTAIRLGLHIDMRSMNQLVWFKPESRCVRVQAGVRWRDLQSLIDSHDLAVKTMQSYSNFTVGGSVSVNVHGRYVGNGPICNSVRALQLVLADGSILEASRAQNTELFRAAIGGYGAIGVITEVELELAANVRMERTVQEVPLERYPEYFKAILSDKANILHNADLIPPLFNAPLAITWKTTSKPPTESGRLLPQGLTYPTEQNVIWALTELPFAENLQKDVVRPMRLSKPAVVWRNREASRDVAELEPRTRRFSTYALQEYFIPVRHFASFVKSLGSVLRQHNVEALNVSIRHAPADTLSMLPWAKEEVFCFVLYYKQRTTTTAMERVGRWTRELIELTLANEGRYYLPYQLHATQSQFDRAYPEAGSFRLLKKSIDPANKLSNAMWDTYL
ncbi:MAG: FAD-binding protein [Paucimonas sp.]|nr:FAD-binding protein [Paucimonas sp.]